MLLALLAIAWMIGIAATDTLALPGEVLAGVLLLGLSGAVLGWRIRITRLAGLCLLFAALGGLRYHAVQVETTPRSVWLLAGQNEVLLQGIIAEDPIRSDDGQQVLLSTEAARLGARTDSVEGLVLIALPPWPAYAYGQRLLVQGALDMPPATDRPNAFNYRAYLARKGIFALMQEPQQVQVLPGNAGNPLLSALLGFRSHCYGLILRGMPEPQASVAAGMLLGLKTSIPQQTYAQFSLVGASHLLVISGWQLSLVASLIMGAAARLRLGKRTSFWFSLAAIWIYALFVGASATVLRAAVMASLIVLAATTGRRSEPWTLLLAACLALTLWNPQILWDLGFQLSALATASLFAFSQPARTWLERCPPLRWPATRLLTDALAATLAAQVLILPLLLYHFGNLSLVAPLANVALVPVVPFAMLVGTAALLVNVAAAPLSGLPLAADLTGWLSSLLWLVAWLPFAYMTEAARLLSEIPWAAVRLPAFPFWLLPASYAVIAAWWFGGGNR